MRFLVAALAALSCGFVPLAPARANPGCSPDDFANAVASTVSNFNSACLSQFGDFAFYALTVGLGATATAGASSQVQDACSQAENALQQAAAAAKSVKDLRDTLNSMGALGAAIKQFLKDEVGLDVDDDSTDPSKLTAAASSALQPLICACNVVTDPGISQLGNDLGACLSDGLDYLDCALLGNCGPQPTAPTQITCTPTGPCQQDQYGYWRCDPYNTSLVGGVVEVNWTTPETAFACSGDICLGGNNWCYCPKVMQKPDSCCLDGTTGEEFSYLTCACPGTSHALGSGNLAYICVCDDGQRVGDDGVCPQPPPACNPSCPNNQVATVSDKKTCTFSCGCASGQTNIGDRCVTPCADPGQALLANGSCCAPSQATSCGTCCPAGMKPDPRTGACTAVPILKPTQFQKQPQVPRKL